MIIGTHCHVIVAEMTAGAVPEHWRPAVSRDGGAGHAPPGSDRPADRGTTDAVGEVRALGLAAGEDPIVSGKAARRLGAAGGGGPAGRYRTNRRKGKVEPIAGQLHAYDCATYAD